MHICIHSLPIMDETPHKGHRKWCDDEEIRKNKYSGLHWVVPIQCVIDRTLILRILPTRIGISDLEQKMENCHGRICNDI